MPHFCFRARKTCPTKFAIGKEGDSDVISQICPNCRKLIHQSDIRIGKVKKRLRILFFLALMALFVLGVYAYLMWDDASSEQKKIIEIPPGEVVKNFFKNLNQDNYLNAYTLTNNTRWPSLEDFERKLAHWRLFHIKEISGKSYYSSYQPDTIINLKYNGTIDGTLTNDERDYDYLLKQYSGEWKIIRILNPRTPGMDALKREEVPKTAKESVRQFLHYLDQGLYEKAYVLTANKKWGNKTEFISTDRGWGCISEVDIEKIETIEEISTDFKIVYAYYYAEDPCNESKWYEFNFQVKKRNGLWRITKATNPLNNR